MNNYRPPNLLLARKLNYWAIGISILVLGLVSAMRRYKIETEIDFSILPVIYSSINILVAITLVVALVFIKRKEVHPYIP